jgi:hypothetical protein
MTELTSEQQRLIVSYSSYDEQELLNLLGNQLTELGSESAREAFVLGTPNVMERGRKYLAQTAPQIAAKICPIRQSIADKIAEFRKQHPDAIDPLAWTATLLDMGLRHFTAGVPPITVAVTLGKLCNYSVEKFCQTFEHP